MKRLLIACALWLATAAQAHEYWLMPSRFSAPAGERIGVGHRVGSGWPGEPLPRNPQRVVRFALVDGRGERPIAGAAGDEPAGTVTLRTTGLSIALYRSTASPVVLEAAQFESYLRDEGLEHVVAWRAARGQSLAPGRERFSRNAKALIAVGAANAGTASGAAADRPLGLALELVAEANLRRLAGGGRLVVRLLHEGRPLAGTLVKAIAEDLAQPRIERRSDAAGRVVFDLPAGGVWLVNAVHIMQAPAGSDYEWDSLWSSLTFELAR